MTIMILLDNLMNSLENGEIVVNIYLDFQFIFLILSIMIFFLPSCIIIEFKGNALQWRKSYMSERKQFVPWNSTSSSMKKYTVVYHRVINWV